MHSQDKQQKDVESTNLPGENLHIDDYITSESPSLSSYRSPAPPRRSGRVRRPPQRYGHNVYDV